MTAIAPLADNGQQQAEQRDIISQVAPPRYTEADILDLEKQARVQDRLRRLVVGFTHESQWCDFGGKPYLEGDGALALGDVLGLTFPLPRFEWRELPGGAYQCVCWQEVYRANADARKFADFGDCDEFDDFLAKRRGDLEKNGATAEQIRGALRVEMEKKARANAISRCVSGFTGVRGLSWADLEALGLKREKASANVEFRKGGKGGKVEHVPLNKLSGLKEGSVVAIAGGLVSGDQRTAKSGTKYCDFTLDDGTGKAQVKLWGEKPDWFERGILVTVPKCKVGSYQGKPQYTAESVEPGADGPPPEAETPAKPADAPSADALLNRWTEATTP